MLLLSLSISIASLLALCVFGEVFELLLLVLNVSRASSTVSAIDPTFSPSVSLHVPVCREPVPVVVDTLVSLANLHYPNYEVVVVSNNTLDPALWRPVEALCLELGSKFRFYNLPQWPGYKAGALNFALSVTSAVTDVIGVVDADYQVEPYYIDRLISYFADPRVGFVQSPQDYRDWNASIYRRMCYWEYRQFFAVGMVVRSRVNAIMLHGTMSLIRLTALTECGGWDEQCVTEDSELGIRILANKYHSFYLLETCGRGLLPLSARDYKRQRWRWVSGGAQQFKKHFALLFWRPGLTAQQRWYHFQAWTPWIRDSLVVISVPVLLASCLADRLPNTNQLTILGGGLLLVVTHHLFRQLFIGKIWLKLSWTDTVGAALAVFGLTFVVGVAWMLSIVGRRTPFVPTPKLAPRQILPPRRLLFGSLVPVLSMVLSVALACRIGFSRPLAAVVPLLYLFFIVPSICLDILSGLTNEFPTMERTNRAERS